MNRAVATRRAFELLVVGLLLAPCAVSANDRPVVGVADFENHVGRVPWWYQGAGRDLAASLSRELTSAGAVAVMGREEVAKAASPQPEADAPAPGPGQRFLVRPALSYYREKKGSRAGRFRIKGVNVQARRRGAEMTVDFEIVDLADGRTVHRESVDTRSGGLDVNVGYHQPELSGGLSHHENQPAGKAIGEVTTRLSERIGCLLAGATCDR